jgi:DMSO/TMAO reductase YedYZ heme-binding membrane subunit
MTSSMKTRAIWVGLLLSCCAPLIVWMASVNDPMSYFRLGGLPPGQQLYLVAKLAGLFAFCLFWLQCMLALARHAPVVPAFPVSDLRLHRRLGIATALLILAHVVCFIVAASLRTGHASWDLLLPNFTHGYYKFYLGLGAIAFWIVCLTVFAGWRVARGQQRWKAIHRLWPAVFGLAFLHAFAIGTESRFGAMRYLVIFIVVSLVIAGIIRFLHSRKDSSSTSPRWHPESGVAE